MWNLVLLGHFKARVQHSHHRVLILGVERIGSTDHHDEVHLKPEGLQAPEHILQVRGIGSGKEGDLHGVELDRGGAAELAHAGNDLEVACPGAGQFAVFVGSEGSDEHQMGRNDADFDFGFVAQGHG